MIIEADFQNDPDSDGVVHSNLEHTILFIPISEIPVNIRKHQLIISHVLH